MAHARLEAPAQRAQLKGKVAVCFWGALLWQVFGAGGRHGHQPGAQHDEGAGHEVHSSCNIMPFPGQQS